MIRIWEKDVSLNDSTIQEHEPNQGAQQPVQPFPESRTQSPPPMRDRVSGGRKMILSNSGKLRLRPRFGQSQITKHG